MSALPSTLLRCLSQGTGPCTLHLPKSQPSRRLGGGAGRRRVETRVFLPLCSFIWPITSGSQFLPGNLCQGSSSLWVLETLPLLRPLSRNGAIFPWLLPSRLLFTQVCPFISSNGFISGMGYVFCLDSDTVSVWVGGDPAREG